MRDTITLNSRVYGFDVTSQSTMVWRAPCSGHRMKLADDKSARELCREPTANHKRCRPTRARQQTNVQIGSVLNETITSTPLQRHVGEFLRVSAAIRRISAAKAGVIATADVPKGVKTIKLAQCERLHKSELCYHRFKKKDKIDL
jgi:hypothetical protein